MPPLPKLKIDALAELARQLRFESPEAARRQLERAEALTLEILAECARHGAGDKPAARTYPLDYIVFRVTGLRPDTRAGESHTPTVLIGEALLADLPALIERLSAAARLQLSDLEPPGVGTSGRRARTARERATRSNTKPIAPALRGPWLDLNDLARRWSIGTKTIERSRRRGLLSRRVRTGGAGRGAAAREKIVFAESAVLAFEAAGGWKRMTAAGDHTPRVAAARAPRLSARERERIVNRAARYRRHFGWSLNRCALRIARSIDRSHESVRRALRRHDAASATPIFDERPPLSDHERALVERHRRAGGSPAELAERLSRSRGSMHRVAADRRAERLRVLALDGPAGPLFHRTDAADVLLAPASVRRGLGSAAPATIGDFVAIGESMSPPALAVESARAVAYAFLRYRALAAIRALPRHGVSVAVIDAIETDLRWASRVKVELVRSQLPTALRSIRARLGGRGPDAISPRGPAGGPALIDACIDALVEAVDRFDPFKAIAGGGRLAAPAAIAVNRALTRWLQAAESSGRGLVGAGTGDGKGGGLAAHKSDTVPIGDWTLRVDPWQAWLELPESLARVARAVAAESGPAKAKAARREHDDLRLIRVRAGFMPEGDPPRTLQEAATILGLTAQGVAARERRIIGAAVSAGRPPKRSGRARG